MMIYHFMTILSVVHTHTHTMKKNVKISYVAYELVSNFANFYILNLLNSILAEIRKPGYYILSTASVVDIAFICSSSSSTFLIWFFFLVYRFLSLKYFKCI